jgi:type I restriction enzyme S subunit
MEKQLPKNWISVSLKEITNNVKGKKPKIQSEVEFEGSVPYMDIKALEYNEIRQYADIESSKVFEEGDVAMVWDGARSGWVSKTNFGAIGSTLVAFKPTRINSNYLFYYLLEKYPFINSNARGVGIPHVDPTVLWSLDFPLPPLAEQNRIVAKLDKLFAQLEIIKTSMANIPLLLKDFRQQVLTQAVTGKLTNCNIKEKRLGDLLIDVKYGTSMKSEYEIDGTPIFRIPNINDGEINDLDLKYSILNDKEYNQLKLVEGDVLIIRSNGSVTLVGRSAIIRKKHEGFSYAGYLIRLRCGQELNSEFLNYSLKSDFLRTQIVSTSHSSSGVNNINSQEIKDLKIFWAQPKEQLEIVKRIEILFTKADAIEQQYHSLKQKIDTLPQALLHKAFKGELTEQLESDGDARELLKQIQELKTTAGKTGKKVGKKVKTYEKE